MQEFIEMMPGSHSPPPQLPGIEKEFKGISTGYIVLAYISSILGVSTIRCMKPQPSLIIIPLFRFPELLITPGGGRVIEFRTIALSRTKIKEALGHMEPYCRYYGIELIRD